jgi:hypothetical protein
VNKVAQTILTTAQSWSRQAALVQPNDPAAASVYRHVSVQLTKIAAVTENLGLEGLHGYDYNVPVTDGTKNAVLDVVNRILRGGM